MPQTSNFEWIDRDEYPFRSHYLSTQHGDMHYVDEGVGEVILFVHGNPTWSFMHHLVGGHKQRLRYRQAERPCGFEVDDKTEFCRLLDRQIGWAGAFQNAPDIVQAYFAMSRWNGS